MIGTTLSNLIREGVVSLYHDYRAGHCRDMGSLAVNHGTPSAACKWSRGALTFPGGASYVEVPDHASLRFVTGSLILLGRWDKQPAGQVMIRKLTSAVDCNIYWLSNASQIYLYDGTRVPVLAFSIPGSRTLGTTYVSGVAPIGYKDGVLVGNYSQILVPVVSPNVLRIGSTGSSDHVQSPIEAVVMCNRVLTATEMAAVHSDLVNARWPSRYVSIAKRPQGSKIGEPTLKAGYTLKPVGTQVPSHDGAFVGTVSGQASYKDSILGPALELGRVTGAVDLGIGNATINPVVDSHWVECWARPLDVAMTDSVVPIIGKGLLTNYQGYNNFGVYHSNVIMKLIWHTGAGYASVDGAVPRNKLSHILYQIDRVLNQAYLYVDGVSYGPTAVGAILAAEATNWVVGKSGSIHAQFDESFGGLVCNPRIGLGVLTAAQVQARYLEGARAIQFKTDYGFQVSPVAEGGVVGQQIGGTSSPFRASDASGRWKIETDTIEGKSCKVLTCTTTDLGINIPISNLVGATPTEAAFGTWDFWYYKVVAPQSIISIVSVGTGIVDGYAVVWSSAAQCGLWRTTTGELLPGTASLSAWHHFRITRSITGRFTFYIDGVFIGIADNTAVLASTHLVLRMITGDKISLGDTLGGHGITKMLGVTTPTEG